jgi:hypothetical protein
MYFILYVKQMYIREGFNPDIVTPKELRKRIEQVEMKCELVHVDMDRYS